MDIYVLCVIITFIVLAHARARIIQQYKRSFFFTSSILLLLYVAIQIVLYSNNVNISGIIFRDNRISFCAAARVLQNAVISFLAGLWLRRRRAVTHDDNLNILLSICVREIG